MRAFALVVVTACATPPSEAPPTGGAPTPPPVAIEAPPPATAEPLQEAVSEQPRRIDPVRPADAHLFGGDRDRRARLAFRGALHGSEPAGPHEGEAPGPRPIAGGDERQEAHGERVDVVEERPTSLRIVVENDEVRLVAYADRADFHRVIRRSAPATVGEQRRAPRKGEDGIWLRAGVRVEERVGDLVRAVIDDAIYAGTAWVDHDAVDIVYEREPEDPGASVVIAAGTPITTREGETLLTVRSAVMADELGTEGDRTRVRYTGDQLVVEGWVTSDPLAPVGSRGFGSGRGGWGTSGPRRYLHAGDRLHASHDGEAIGVVFGERVLASDLGPHEGGHKVRFPVNGWWFSLWIPAEDARHGDAWETVYERRVQLEPVPPGGKLPVSITGRRAAIHACWNEATERPQTALSLRLTWANGRAVPVPRSPGMDDALRGCLSKALEHLFATDGHPLPISFVLRLDPAPYPGFLRTN